MEPQGHSVEFHGTPRSCVGPGQLKFFGETENLIKIVMKMSRRVMTTKIVACIRLEAAPERENVLRDSR